MAPLAAGMAVLSNIEVPSSFGLGFGALGSSERRAYITEGSITECSRWSQASGSASASSILETQKGLVQQLNPRGGLCCAATAGGWRTNVGFALKSYIIGLYVEHVSEMYTRRLC